MITVKQVFVVLAHGRRSIVSNLLLCYDWAVVCCHFGCTWPLPNLWEGQSASAFCFFVALSGFIQGRSVWEWTVSSSKPMIGRRLLFVLRTLMPFKIHVSAHCASDSPVPTTLIMDTTCTILMQSESCSSTNLPRWTSILGCAFAKLQMAQPTSVTPSANRAFPSAVVVVVVALVVTVHAPRMSECSNNQCRSFQQCFLNASACRGDVTFDLGAGNQSRPLANAKSRRPCFDGHSAQSQGWQSRLSWLRQRTHLDQCALLFTLICCDSSHEWWYIMLDKTGIIHIKSPRSCGDRRFYLLTCTNDGFLNDC